MMSVKKVLVVDDEPRNVKLISAYLKVEGFDPLPAYSGEEAIRVAREENPDVVLLDIMMPDMDGYEVTARLKTDALTRHIPIVLVTSLDGSENRTKGLNVGADEFLTKPVNRVELIARVRALRRLKKMHEELQIRKEVVSKITDMRVKVEAGGSAILLVEDDEFLGKQIADVLGHYGYDLTVVKTARDAREIAEREVFDLVLLDRILPDGDGIVLLGHLKGLERFADVPVIVITAFNDLEKKTAALDQGADDYLIKPIEHAELQARIKAGLRRSQVIKKLRLELEQAQSSTVTDRLTGVRNRHYLDADLGYRIAQAERADGSFLSVLMVDIDFFKEVNDTFGHLVGDKVLCEVSRQLVGVARAGDIVTRFGGEEFCIVLPETEINEALAVAERCRKRIEETVFSEMAGKSLTISIGVAQYKPEDTKAVRFLERADNALYDAKARGRNKVSSRSEQLSPDQLC